MSVTAPPGASDRERDHELRETVALREQALIEEARRRARRRRWRNATLALAVITIAGTLAVAFGHGVGVSAKTFGGGQDPSQVAPWHNGRIAVADRRTLQLVDPNGSDPQVVSSCATAPACWVAEPAWSPDGRRLAYVRGPFPFLGRPGRPEMWLYVRDFDNGSVRRLVVCGTCAAQNGARLSWSPDGSQVAFSRDSRTPAELSLWLIDVGSMRLRRLTNCLPRKCADFDPAWAPDGQLIAFTRIERYGSSLYTVRPNGSNLTKITTVPHAAHPQWSADGNTLAFDTHDSIYVIGPDGSGQKRLFAGTRGNGPGVPSWSPDGRLAYFNTPGRPGGYTAEVWTMNADGSDKRRLYHSACCVFTWAAPIWSPDGRQIAFAASSAGGTYIINSDGSGLRRLTTVAADALAWQRKP